MAKKLHYYLFSYTRRHNDSKEEKQVKTLFIVAYDAKEASKMFNAFCEHNHIRLLGLVITTKRKNKTNARVLNNDFYEREQKLIESWHIKQADA